MAPGQLDTLIVNEMEKLNLKLDAIIPQDEQIYLHDLKNKPLLELPDEQSFGQSYRPVNVQGADTDSNTIS